MKDDANPSDYIAPPPPRGTLPPAAKTWAIVFEGLERLGKELGLPLLTLLAVRWDLLDKREGAFVFISAVSTVLGGTFALRRAEASKTDAEAK